MSRAGFGNHRVPGLERHVLKPLDDRSRFDGFTGKQVGGTHQGTYLDAAFQQRYRQRRNHCSAWSIMDSAGVQDTDFFHFRGRQFTIQQYPGHALPENKTRARAHVPATLVAFENEVPRPFLEIQFQDRR